jgi:hypothetical protein
MNSLLTLPTAPTHLFTLDGKIVFTDTFGAFYAVAPSQDGQQQEPELLMSEALPHVACMSSTAHSSLSRSSNSLVGTHPASLLGTILVSSEHVLIQLDVTKGNHRVLSFPKTSFSFETFYVISGERELVFRIARRPLDKRIEVGVFAVADAVSQKTSADLAEFVTQSSVALTTGDVATVPFICGADAEEELLVVFLESHFYIVSNALKIDKFLIEGLPDFNECTFTFMRMYQGKIYISAQIPNEPGFEIKQGVYVVDIASKTFEFFKAPDPSPLAAAAFIGEIHLAYGESLYSLSDTLSLQAVFPGPIIGLFEIYPEEASLLPSLLVVTSEITGIEVYSYIPKSICSETPVSIEYGESDGLGF